jgi:uncharacterized protein (DUF3820 family)
MTVTTIPFGVHRGRPVGDVPTSYLVWVLKTCKLSSGLAAAVAAFIDANRWAILGDLLAILRRPVAPLARHSRWGAWEELVLARLPEPADAQKVIEERQAAVDEDQEEADLVREAFAQELRDRGHDPDEENVFIPSGTAADILNAATNERRPTIRASAHLKTLGVRELRKSAKDGVKGWQWCGADAGHRPAVPIRERASAFSAASAGWPH